MVVLIIASSWIIISVNLLSCYITVYIWYFIYSVIYVELNCAAPSFWLQRNQCLPAMKPTIIRKK